MQKINRKSSAIDELYVYPTQGKVTVMFKDGHIYEYVNVSRRAILNVLTNAKVSLGKWVNKNLINNDRVSFEWVGVESPLFSYREPSLPELN